MFTGSMLWEAPVDIVHISDLLNLAFSPVCIIQYTRKYLLFSTFWATNLQCTKKKKNFSNPDIIYYIKVSYEHPRFPQIFCLHQELH